MRQSEWRCGRDFDLDNPFFYCAVFTFSFNDDVGDDNDDCDDDDKDNYEHDNNDNYTEQFVQISILMLVIFKTPSFSQNINNFTLHLKTANY